MKHYSSILLMAICASACAQPASYKDSINQYRQHYKEEFLTEERSPLTAADTGFLRFFPIDEQYRVTARLTLTPDAKAFDMPTASGQTKRYQQYGLLTFNINDTLVSLQVLRSLKLLKDPKYKDHLFVPFTDATTYNETYGGGRYLDLSLQDVHDGTIELDFNKCYNPWCAFASGYSCPIPPKENRLSVAIPAGEMNFGKVVEH
ncbi:MAG: DUF1684 domain-containing protein [Chitinophagales bacterium]|nr:DUF1684 domain-containing protein [Chitinophagales bacterium]